MTTIPNKLLHNCIDSHHLKQTQKKIILFGNTAIPKVILKLTMAAS